LIDQLCLRHLSKPHILKEQKCWLCHYHRHDSTQCLAGI
jgi:hypothetical protein